MGLDEPPDARSREQIEDHLVEVVQFATMQLKYAAQADKPAARARLQEALRALSAHLAANRDK